MTTATITDLTPTTSEFEERARWCRAGILNVHRYSDAQFTFDSGRLVLRGTNGSGKSRAMDMLFPFLLSGDRRKMGSGTSGQVTIDSLMRVGLGTAVNRTGYVWAECRNPNGEYVTVGAFFRYSANTRQSNVAYFITPQRVGHDLHLLDAQRRPLERKALAEAVGAHRVTDIASVHRDRVAQELFGLTDDRGRARFRAYLDMLYKLRTPDIGVRIDNGEVTRLLSESLPPLSDDVLQNAGQQLDGLTETRQQQRRLEEAAADAAAALQVYTGYTATVITAAATDVSAAINEAAATQTRHQAVVAAETAADTAHSQADARHKELTGEVASLSARKRGLEASQAYKDAQTMVQRESTVRALEGTADTALTALTASRREAARATERAGKAAVDTHSQGSKVASLTAAASAAAAAAGLPFDLPLVTVTITPGREQTIVSRRTIHAEETAETRAGVPTVQVAPPALTTITDRLGHIADAGKARHDAAAARRAAAHELEADVRKVENLEERSADAAKRATEAGAAAVAADGHANNERVRLADAWARWVNSAETIELLGTVDEAFNTAAGVGPIDVDAVDRFQATVAQPVHIRLGLAETDVDTRDAAAAEEQSTLGAEREKLVANTDQPPAGHPWVTVTDGIPFWRAVDFAAGVPASIQAAVETALHTAGILTGTLTADGVSPAHGQLLVTASGTEAAHPITEVLITDGGSGLADVARAVLSRIGWNDPSQPVNINDDGSWQVGVTSGRPAVLAGPHHIGASARARTRRTRIQRIDELLIDLAELRAALTEERHQLHATQKRINDLIAGSPPSGGVRSADASARAAAVNADSAADDSKSEDTAAQSARSAWDERFTLHRKTCTLAGLPVRSSDLHDVSDQARAAVAACGTATSAVTDLGRTHGRFTDAATEAITAEQDADTTNATAAHARARWAAAVTELNEMTAAAGQTAQTVLSEIKTVEDMLEQASTDRERAQELLPVLAGGQATARANTETVAAQVAASHTDMLGAARRLSTILGLPGVLDAAADAHTAPPEVQGIDSARALILWTAETVPRGRTVTIDDMHRAVDDLRQRVAPTFDVSRHMRENVLLVDLIDADGTRTLTTAAIAVAEQSTTGRQALLDSEYAVFHRFIIGGVASELRRSITLAEQTIRGTNERVAGYRTSNNIGVRLEFSPDQSLGLDLARIRGLVAIADEIRTTADTSELTTLLREAADAVYNDNPAGGYTTALTTALDYRKWFTVEAIILGPEQDRKRPLRKAGLSSGELRYVSYLTLICALDAHMSALPAIAPRLLLLDDAFAMVDDHGRRNLLKILVGRDIDFVMTGHDLWLAFPEVKGLDLYDIVATGEDNPATTVHYHWDGRQRSLRST